jgi:hypothetical protein
MAPAAIFMGQFRERGLLERTQHTAPDALMSDITSRKFQWFASEEYHDPCWHLGLGIC